MSNQKKLPFFQPDATREKEEEFFWLSKSNESKLEVELMKARNV